MIPRGTDNVFYYQEECAILCCLKGKATGEDLFLEVKEIIVSGF